MIDEYNAPLDRGALFARTAKKESVMNMNKDIVNRALLSAGQSPLEDADIKTKNSNYELCKAYYIATFLEALTEVEWVGGRKRTPLALTGKPVVSDTRYRFVYDMPYDCARPIELQDNEPFIIEDRLLLTDVDRAELLYVSNGRVLRPIAAASNGAPGELHEEEYFSAGQPWTVPDYTLYPTLYPGVPADIKNDGLPDDPPPDADYPGFTALNYEPKFYEYIEKKLSAKFSMKLSDKPQLHTQLLQESLLVQSQAVDASRAGRGAKVKENKFWGEELGLG